MTMAGAVAERDREPGEVDRLDNALERLHHGIDLLGSRLDPALAPSEPEAKLDTVRELRSPLGNRIDRLEDLTERLSSLTRRIVL